MGILWAHTGAIGCIGLIECMKPPNIKAQHCTEYSPAHLDNKEQVTENIEQITTVVPEMTKVGTLMHKTVT